MDKKTKVKVKNIWDFIKGINKAYYIAAIAIVVSLIYFLPWIDIDNYFWNVCCNYNSLCTNTFD